jgi:hypothetical protein
MLERGPKVFNLINARSALLLILLVAITAPGYGQKKKARFDPDGSFWILGTPPNEFSDFGGINLNAKRSRRLPSAGVNLTNGKNLRFESVMVAHPRLTFKTVALRGLSYEFTGHFLKGGVFVEADLDDKTPVLEGLLIKYKAGKRVSSATLKFIYFGGT